MSNLVKQDLKSLMSSEDVKLRLSEILGKKASTFATSVIQIVNQNKMLAECDPHSIIGSAMVSATLDLPLNQSLGFAYIVPYNQKQSGGSYIKVAQFQIGYKGLIQLAQRSGQFKTISATPILEGQIVSENPLEGYEFDFTKKESKEVIGYAAYFKLINGFEKVHYMTIDQLKAHGLKYSKTFKKEFGLWNTDFDTMATKTVLKLLLSKFAPMSIDMLQKAIITDQSLVNDFEGNDVTYLDNDTINLDHEQVSEFKEDERIKEFIETADSVEKLNELKNQLQTEEQENLFAVKQSELENS